MKINADFAQRAVVTPAEGQWIHSPESGVDRIMLDRIGDEVARATSIVRYAPGSAFPRHEHAKGEEFLVLEGVFSDETGDYPEGSYVRNPPGSGHAPFSTGGCRILVKLRQFDASDLRQFSVDTRDAGAWEARSDTLALHEFGSERVWMQRLAAGQPLPIEPGVSGTEIFIVEGSLREDACRYPRESWLRFPAGSGSRLSAPEPALLWVKTGHLPGPAG